MAHINRKFIDKHWLVFCLRGALALIFGFFALSGKIQDLPYAISLISVFLLAMGIIDSSNALYNSTKKRGWGNAIFDALIDIVAALLLLFAANNNIVFSLIIISIYTAISGVIDLIHSVVSTVDPTDRFIRAILGICGTIMGLVIINAGDFEITAFIRFFGAYMLIVGVCSFIYGIHNRSQNLEDRAARKESAAKVMKSFTKKPAAKKTAKKPATKKAASKKSK